MGRHLRRPGRRPRGTGVAGAPSAAVTREVGDLAFPLGRVIRSPSQVVPFSVSPPVARKNPPSTGTASMAVAGLVSVMNRAAGGPLPPVAVWTQPPANRARRAKVKALRVAGLAMDAGESDFDVCDAHSADLAVAYATVFDPNSGFRDDLVDWFDVFGSDLLLFDYVILSHPAGGS